MKTNSYTGVTGQIEIKDPLKKFYVYALIDERDLSEKGIFYIGKGTAKRAMQHGVDALRLNNLEMTEEDLKYGSAKLSKINEIRAEGKEPLVRVLARYDSEAEAFAAEAILIQTVFGRLQDGGQLTNIVLGHNSRYIRSRGIFDEIPRLDIPKTTRMEDGEYSKSALDKLRKNSVQEKAEEAVEQLRQMIKQSPKLCGQIVISDPAIIESGRYVGAKVNFGVQDVILRLQFTPNSLITNLRAADEGTKEGRVRFSSRMENVGLEVLKDGAYGWVPGWKNNGLGFKDYEGMLTRLEECFELFVR